MSDCLFCKIVSGDVPSKKVYEDEYVYAFEDINPVAPVHIHYAEGGGISLRYATNSLGHPSIPPCIPYGIRGLNPTHVSAPKAEPKAVGEDFARRP